MQVDDPRFALSAILRRASPDIIRRVVEEAARSSGAGPDEVRAYEDLMIARTPALLGAIASDDESRARAFATLVATRVVGLRPVPPVARVGLLEIAARLARAEVERGARGRPDAERIVFEFDVMIGQVRAALSAVDPSRDRSTAR